MSTITELPTEYRKHVIEKKDGLGAYALYLDFVVYNKTTGKLVRQDRKLLVSRLYCTYSRQHGNKRAAWKTHVLANHDAAREMLMKSVARMEGFGLGIEMIHPPILVEMTVADIESVGANEAPPGRHAAVAAVEKAIGKIDDDAWRPRVATAAKSATYATATATTTIEIDGTEYEVPTPVLDSLANEKDPF